jgi:hypothetical protein
MITLGDRLGRALRRPIGPDERMRLAQELECRQR